MAESLRDEIIRRGWWLLKNHGFDRPNYGNLRCTDAVIAGDYLLRNFFGGYFRNYFLIFLKRKRDAQLVIKFSSDVARWSGDSSYDECQQIVAALRKKMVLDDLSSI